MQPVPAEEKIWQVVKERLSVSGAVISSENFGTPRTLQSAKQILEYKNATELRRDVRYRAKRANDN